jgi:hypothetical protein
LFTNSFWCGEFPDSRQSGDSPEDYELIGIRFTLSRLVAAALGSCKRGNHIAFSFMATISTGNWAEKYLLFAGISNSIEWLPKSNCSNRPGGNVLIRN